MNTKTETWAGHDIRFVEVMPGDWWAVAKDVATALEYANPSKAVSDHCKGVSKLGIPSTGGNQVSNIISEIDIYNLVFKAADQSRNPRIKEIAEEFKCWVFSVIKELRAASGLEGFQIFRMLDKEHQKDTMRRLCDGLYSPVQVDFIKANTIANKAVSTMYGHPKMLKKEQMTPDMLVKRQPVLDDTVNLMLANEAFDLGLSVSQAVYRKYN